MSEVHQAWLDVRPVYREEPGQVVPACATPSPTNRMLCDLPATPVIPGQPPIPHWIGQHVGVDRQGNLRGWRDERAPVE